MANLIELKEAAALLGLTPEQLTDLRSRSKIFGYRDGSTWKFKESELQRYADQNDIDYGAAPPPEPEGPKKAVKPKAAVDADLDEMVDVDMEDVDMEDDADSILAGENELGSGPGASSTIIGKEELSEDLLGSDLKLASSDEGESSGGSSLNLDLDGSDLKLSSDSGTGSELKIAGGSELNLDSSGSGSFDLEVDDLDLTLGSGVAQGSKSAGDSELNLAGDSEIDVSLDAASSASGMSDFDLSFDDDGSELKLSMDSAVKPGSSGSDLLLDDASTGSSDSGDQAGSGVDDDLILDAAGTGGSGGSLDLGDDELLLEGSDGGISELNFDESGIDLDIASGTDVGLVQDGSGSDVTLNAGDSGINLSRPSESGISLETESVELGGSGVEALELGEADIVDLDEGSEIDFEAATQLKADDDFLLSPAEGALGEDADSGSQVIALDTEEFGDADDGMLGSAAQVIDVDEEFGAASEGAAGAVSAGGIAVAAGAGAAAAGDEAAEAPYSLYNVLGLAGCMILLSLTGIMMIDLLRNMWSWNEPYTINSKLMDFIISLFGN